MKTRLIIFLYFIANLLMSCHKSEKYENASLFSFEDFNITSELNATTVEFDEPIMKPLSFVKSDSLLIVQNLMTKNMLYVYNINSKKKIGEFISWGSGPNDLLRIKDMQLVGSDLYISDSQKRAVYTYDINDFHNVPKTLIPTQKITIDDFFYHIAYTENGYIALTLNPENKRLVFYNSKGEKELTFGEYPHYGSELTMLEKMEGFNASIVISHKYKWIYLFGMTTDLIEKYDFKGKLIKKIHGPDQIFPQAKEIHTTGGLSRISALEKSKFTYFRPIIIDDEIYVSYSGKHQNIGKEEFPPINHIFVFDLDCNPVRRYELPISIIAFTVDTDTKLIYATSNTPDFHLNILQ